MSQSISWFIETDGNYQRVEEELVSISDKEFTFTRDGDSYTLSADFSLSPYVYGDVIFVVQQDSTLAPIVIPVTQDEPLLSQNEVDAIIKTQVQELEAKVIENRQLIQKLLAAKSDIIAPQAKIFDELADFRQFLQNPAHPSLGAYPAIAT